MRIGTREGRRETRKGVAAVELACLMPVLLLIVLGCIDFGRFAYAYISVTSAARAGAGYGSVHPYTTATFGKWQAAVQQAAAEDASSLPGFDASKMTITTAVESGGLWRVQVTAVYEFKTIVSWPGMPADTTMKRTVQMRGTR